MAGGCFWGVEGYFRTLTGVLDTEVGYANGTTNNTRYEYLPITDHAETLKLVYDEYKLSLVEIIDHFFRIIDPTSLNRQGNDIGRQYRSGIYSRDAETLDKVRALVENKQNLYSKKIVVEVEELSNFITAEDYHQDYLVKHPRGYCHIDLSLADEPLYGKYEVPSYEYLKDNLSDISFSVTKKGYTEAPFSSPLNDNFEDGIYVDIISKEPLFSSRDKFNAGCGWPSFSRPITSYVIEYRYDDSDRMNRTETVSKNSHSHLGHLFEDGKKPGNLRYCINGASLEFVPYDEMDERGYSDFKKYVK